MKRHNGNPATLVAYLLRLFLPFFLGAVVFFVLILELMDLFGNLWRYLALDVPAALVAKVSLLYMPTCVSYALPVALLFATAYTLGSMYAHNELVAVFSTGLPLIKFVAPLVALSVLFSIGSFYFSDIVVLKTVKQKTDFSRQLLGLKVSYSNADVAVIAKDGSVVYRADYYDDATQNLSGLTIIEREGAGDPVARTEAAQARFEDGAWVLSRARRFEKTAGGNWKEESFGTLREAAYDEPPSSFRTQNRDISEMSVAELDNYVEFLRRAGLPYQAALAERHKRLAFSFAPFIVVFISSALGGKFRKNVLLMSLLSSLVVATGYYVTQMITMLLAKTGLIPPALGAWSPLFIFAVLGLALFRKART
jgi:lipopolysaccharide export system permease protein